MQNYQALISLKTISALSTDEAIEHIGLLADAALQSKKRKGLHQALSLSKEIENRPLTIAQQAILYYHIANIWGNLKQLAPGFNSDPCKWEQEHTEKQLIFLRLSIIAVKQDNFRELSAVQISAIYTNLAAALYETGRFVEAIEYWNTALGINPEFSMAKGNRGLGLVHYAHALYDEHQALIFLEQARRDLKAALESGVEPHAQPVFQSYFSDLEQVLSSGAQPHIHLSSGTLGETRDEIAYRSWCLRHCLFLNPLNDLGVFPYAASDPLCTPSIVMEKGEIPYYHGYYNQIKQEFVSARWLYYDGMISQKQHFSDKSVLLHNTLDYPVYGLASEKIKISFRMLYSLFDKIAFFLNRYMNLSIHEKDVQFRTFWYSGHTKSKALRPTLERSHNWALRGLFWLSKDLYEDRAGFKEALEPDARELHTIRNHLEHKYFKLHEASDTPPLLNDPSPAFGFYMHHTEFEIKVLRMLKMVRAALIYLALTIHSEESRRLEHRKASVPFQVMELPIIHDEKKK